MDLMIFCVPTMGLMYKTSHGFYPYSMRTQSILTVWCAHIYFITPGQLDFI